jgi:hypothetical protein
MSTVFPIPASPATSTSEPRPEVQTSASAPSSQLRRSFEQVHPPFLQLSHGPHGTKQAFVPG